MIIGRAVGINYKYKKLQVIGRAIAAVGIQKKNLTLLKQYLYWI